MFPFFYIDFDKLYNIITLIKTLYEYLCTFHANTIVKLFFLLFFRSEH